MSSIQFPQYSSTPDIKLDLWALSYFTVYLQVKVSSCVEGPIGMHHVGMFYGVDEYGVHKAYTRSTMLYLWHLLVMRDDARVQLRSIFSMQSTAIFPEIWASHWHIDAFYAKTSMLCKPWLMQFHSRFPALSAKSHRWILGLMQSPALPITARQ